MSEVHTGRPFRAGFKLKKHASWLVQFLLILPKVAAGILVISLATVGTTLLTHSPEHERLRNVVLGGLTLSLAIVVIFLTAEHWAGFVPGFLFAGTLNRGMNWILAPPPNVTRSQAVVLMVYSVVVLALLWRFIPPRHHPATLLDRVALTLFALSFPLLVVIPAPQWQYPALMMGAIPLFIAWAVSLRNAGHTHEK